MGHDTAEIDNDLPGDLTIGAIADDSTALDLQDTYDDSQLYLDTVPHDDTIANVVTRGQKALTDKPEHVKQYQRRTQKNQRPWTPKISYADRHTTAYAAFSAILLGCPALSTL